MNPIRKVSIPSFKVIREPIIPKNTVQEISKTENILKDCAGFTAETFEMTFSPKYSFLIQGIAGLSQSGSGYGGNIGQGISYLMILSSPAMLALKCLFGIPSVVLGTIATGLVGTAYVVEKTVNAASEGMGNLCKPSEATQRRQKYTENFVFHMKKFLQNFSTAKKEEFESNPGPLICIAATAFAFHARNLEEGKLVGENDNIITKENIAEMGDNAIEYFKAISKMKSCIYDLNLSKDDNHAWEVLVELINQCSLEDNTLEEHQKEALALLEKTGQQFSEKVLEDDFFKAAWKKTFI